jgi:hypothetical protein
VVQQVTGMRALSEGMLWLRDTTMFTGLLGSVERGLVDK